MCEAGGAEGADILGAHGVQILLVGRRVDGDEPGQVVFIKYAVDPHLVDLNAVRFVLRDDAGDDGIHLGVLEILQADVDAAQGQGLLGHAGDFLGVGVLIPKEHIGQGGEHQHGDEQQENQQARRYFNKEGCGLLGGGQGRALGPGGGQGGEDMSRRPGRFTAPAMVFIHGRSPLSCWAGAGGQASPAPSGPWPYGIAPPPVCRWARFLRRRGGHWGHRPSPGTMRTREICALPAGPVWKMRRRRGCAQNCGCVPAEPDWGLWPLPEVRRRSKPYSCWAGMGSRQAAGYCGRAFLRCRAGTYRPACHRIWEQRARRDGVRGVSRRALLRWSRPACPLPQ